MSILWKGERERVWEVLKPGAGVGRERWGVSTTDDGGWWCVGTSSSSSSKGSDGGRGERGEMCVKRWRCGIHIICLGFIGMPKNGTPVVCVH